MSGLLQEIITILVGGITQIATGIGTGLKSLVEAIFVNVTGDAGSQTYSLTTFGGVIIVFAGISLAIGLCRWVMSFITSLGSFN